MEFDPSREEWDQYSECMGNSFNVSAIQSEEREKAYLLTLNQCSGIQVARKLDRLGQTLTSCILSWSLS